MPLLEHFSGKHKPLPECFIFSLFNIFYSTLLKVTGTAKQHVTLDYAQRLAAGVNDASEMVSQAFTELATAAGVPSSLVKGVESWAHCPLVHNESACAPAASASDPSTNGAKVYTLAHFYERTLRPRNCLTAKACERAGVFARRTSVEFSSSTKEVLSRRTSCSPHHFPYWIR